MSNEQNGYRTALLLFAVAVIIVTLAAFVTTFERVDKRASVSENRAGYDGPRQGTPATGSRIRPAGGR